MFSLTEKPEIPCLYIFFRHEKVFFLFLQNHINSINCQKLKQSWLSYWLCCFCCPLEATVELYLICHWQISNWRCGTECHKERSPYCSLWGKCHCQSESDKKTKTKKTKTVFLFFNLMWDRCHIYHTVLVRFFSKRNVIILSWFIA